MRILLFNRSLGSGGAERQLALLALELHRRQVPVAVAALYARGPWRKVLEEAGVEVIDLAKTGRWDVVGCLWRSWRRFRAWQPDVIYSFFGTGPIATVLKPQIPRARLVLSVRASDMDLGLYDWFVRWFDKANLLAMRYADAIVCNSAAGRRHLLAQGVARAERIAVVPNGIEVSRYAFDADKRTHQRSAWNVKCSDRLVGIVARLDPIKGHSTFLSAAALALKGAPDLRFVCAGGGEGPLLGSLQAQAEKLGIADRVIWAGHCSDLTAVYSAMDLLVLASTSEGFPNVIGEGMACGLPVVATDVGDCREIVAEHGWIVSPGDAHALGQAILSASAATTDWDRTKPLDHIAAHYSVEAMVKATLTVLEQARSGCASSTS